MNKHLALVLGLACVANGALAASSLVIASDRSTLVLDYLEVFIGGSKTTYQANLVSTDNLASFTPISASAVGANSAADPATTPRLSLVNGNYVLEIPSVSVGSQTYAVNLVSSNNLASFSVDNGSLKFVNLIVTHLTERGVVEPGLLYEPPFTSYAPQGPDALFTSAQVDALFGVLDHIKATALAA